MNRVGVCFFKSNVRRFSSLEPKIIFQDNDYAMVSKPWGASVSQGVEGDESKTVQFHDMVNKYFVEHFKCSLVPVHGIDRIASGIIVYAKHQEAKLHFSNLKKNSTTALAARTEIVKRKDKKEIITKELITQASLPFVSNCYFALVRGTPDRQRGLLDLGLMRDSKTLRFKCVSRGGDATRTNLGLVTTYPLSLLPSYKLNADSQAKKVDTFTLMYFKAMTHFRSQIRAVCSYLGTPIVGDGDFGGGRFPIPFLHSCNISFLSINGEKEYYISDAPLHWKEYGIPDLSELANSLNNPKNGSLSKIYNRIIEKSESIEATFTSRSDSSKSI